MVKTQIQELGPNKLSLKVEVEKEVVAGAYTRFFHKAAGSVNIPGFRKGKVPKPVLIKHIGLDNIKEEITDSLIRETYPTVLRESHIHPVSPLSVKDTVLNEGESFTFTAEVEVRPKVPEFSYKGRTAKIQRATVDDTSIAGVLEKLREQFGKIMPIEEGILESGDYFLAKMDVSCEGKLEPELSEEKAYHKFADNNHVFAPMKGMKPGETRSFANLVNREEDKSSAYYGKTLDYTVALERISRPTLAELNDDFAREVGEYKTLDELKGKIREDLEERYRKDADERAIEQILAEISNELKLDLPESMIQHTVDFFIENLERRWRRYGTSVQDYLKKSEKKMSDFREEFRDKAIFETRVMMLIDTVAERESIEVLDSEYRHEVERRAKEYGWPAEKLLESLATSDGEENVKNSIMRQKVQEFLLKNNVIQYDMVSDLEINKGEAQGDAGTHSN